MPRKRNGGILNGCWQRLDSRSKKTGKSAYVFCTSALVRLSAGAELHRGEAIGKRRLPKVCLSGLLGVFNSFIWVLLIGSFVIRSFTV